MRRFWAYLEILRNLKQRLGEQRAEELPAVVSSAKIRNLLQTVARDGWWLVRQRGSHRQFKHPSKKGLVTIAGAPNHDVAYGTYQSVLRQAGLKP